MSDSISDRKPIFIFVSFIALIFSLGWAVPAEANLININTADLDTLVTLPGIGPAYGQRIIDYRNANGPFKTIEEITNVSGIGQVTFSNIKDLITVGQTPSADTETSESAGATTTQSSGTSSSSSGSPLYGASASSSGSSSNISINAGKDRVALVGTPIEFKVETSRGLSGQRVFRWNFGDGSVQDGAVLSHIYEYPGEYVVVVYGSFPEGEVTARVNVKVLEAEILIVSASPEKIEIRNNSRHDVNLFGRALASNGEIFAFPRDTIIRAGQNIFFSQKVTKLRPVSINEVEMVVLGDDPWRVEYFVKQKNLEKKEKIALIERSVIDLQNRLALAVENGAREEVPTVEPRPALPAAAPQTPQSILVDSGMNGPGQTSKADDGITQDARLAASISSGDGSVVERWWGKVKRFFLTNKVK